MGSIGLLHVFALAGICMCMTSLVVLGPKAESKPSHEPAQARAACPRCAKMQDQLRYWRQRDWMQKSRDDAWARMRAEKNRIPVNVKSRWTGALVESAEPVAPMEAKNAKVAFSAGPASGGDPKLGQRNEPPKVRRLRNGSHREGRTGGPVWVRLACRPVY